MDILECLKPSRPSRTRLVSVYYCTRGGILAYMRHCELAAVESVHRTYQSMVNCAVSAVEAQPMMALWLILYCFSMPPFEPILNRPLGLQRKFSAATSPQRQTFTADTGKNRLNTLGGLVYLMLDCRRQERRRKIPETKGKLFRLLGKQHR